MMMGEWLSEDFRIFWRTSWMSRSVTDTQTDTENVNIELEAEFAKISQSLNLVPQKRCGGVGAKKCQNNENVPGVLIQQSKKEEGFPEFESTI